MKILVTGTAGFIGSAVASALIARGHQVVGIDNMDAYYDTNLKRDRLAAFCNSPAYRHVYADISDRAAVDGAFGEFKPQRVVHLAAQAGVRYAAQNPHIYVSTNVMGFLNVIEACRKTHVEHLVYASTSSVYGANKKLPYSEHDSAQHPVSLYASTKKANEMMAHSYAHLYRLPCTGLRFFTVYGPWGRPDMSYFQFADSIVRGKPIKLFNYGNHSRDFTYIDDIVDGIVRSLDHIPAPDPNWNGLDAATSDAPYRIYNIGNHERVELKHFVETLERCLGRNEPGPREYLPYQAGDVPDTLADISDLQKDTGYVPTTPVAVGLKKFADWYLDYVAKPQRKGA